MRKTEHKRFLEVGWLMEGSPDPAWGAPRPLDLPALDDASGKAVTACPAVLQHEARMYAVGCPANASYSAAISDGDLRLGPTSDEPGGALGGDSLAPAAAWRWRHPRRPLVEISTPYRFVTDDYCFLAVMPPLYDYKRGRWPGLVLGTRFRLDLWPRRLVWTFEWHDLERPLILERGEPWFYLRFDGRDPARNTQLFEAQRTPELEAHVCASEETSAHLEKSWSLLRDHRQQRPAELVRRQQR